MRIVFKKNRINKDMKRICVILLVCIAASFVAKAQYFSVKTNVLYDLTATLNLGAEFRLAPRWTLDISGNYNPWTFGTSEETMKKWKHAMLQPEARYWLSEDNSGIFVGAHFGLVSYNIALNGDYRYQDKDGNTPAIGGGISIGYRRPISDGNKWNIEFSLGAGAYSLNYDRFYNVTNGIYIDTQKKNYFGIDQVAVTISYTFDLPKKGGKQ